MDEYPPGAAAAKILGVALVFCSAGPGYAIALVAEEGEMAEGGWTVTTGAVVARWSGGGEATRPGVCCPAC